MPAKRVRSNLRQTMIRQDKLIRAELREECRQTARDGAKWLGVAVQGWSAPKPRFAPRVVVRPDLIMAFVDVAGSAKKKFIYVDKGTGKYGPRKRAYLIQPKTPGGKLHFQTGYSAKTAPVAKVNVGTGQRSGPWVKTIRVIHPGIKPRKFTETVWDELNPDFVRRIENAIRRGVRRSG